MANLYGIQLRTGCFCNPGSCQRHLKLTIEDLKQHFQVIVITILLINLLKNFHVIQKNKQKTIFIVHQKKMKQK